MMPLRKLAAGLASIVAASILAGESHAQANYPERLIKMIVPAPAGGQTDVMARLIAHKIHEPLGQTVIIDNRPGAGGALAARAAAAAEPDGYTLLYGNTSTLAVIPAVSKNPGYDPVRNFDPVASVSESYTILVVHPSFPARNIQEFLAHARAHPGRLNYAHAGAGNVTHLIGEMFRSLAGIDFVDVPHKGGNESVQSVLARQVDFAFESPPVPDQGGEAARARRDQREAPAGDSRCAEHGRKWHHELCCHAAYRNRDAGAYAFCNHHKAQ
jgi:tripartite-type tricarboxylate transporter receptor subunit TctC